MTRVKICGLRRREDILYANECRPDYVGFVFADSRRRVTKEQAGELRKMLAPEIVPVGVFVNAPVGEVAGLVKAGIIDMVQLHGDETADYIRQLQALVPEAQIIKAVRVASKEDVRKSEEIQAYYLLFDSFSGKERGGTGRVFDWELIKDVKKPFFLAGGVGIGNISEALQLPNIYAVDVSSAVETDGYKDREKMRKLVRMVRQM